MLRKIMWSLIFTLAISALYIGYSHPDWIVYPQIPKASAATCVGNPGGQCEFNPVLEQPQYQKGSELQPVQPTPIDNSSTIGSQSTCDFGGK